MMLLWIFAGLLSALVVGLLAWPLLRPARREATAGIPAEANADQASDLAVYRDQLGELDRDVARGVLPEAEAAAARLEIQRRLLVAAGRSAAEARAPSGRISPAAKLAIVVLLLLPAMAIGIYLDVGSPSLPGQPFASRAPAPAGDPQLVALADQLTARMKANPADPRGWALLAGAEAELGRYADSADAYRQAILRGQAKGETITAELQSRYGEVLAAAADGQVTAPAKAAFTAALAIDPTEPRARFYLALADAQAGHLDQALRQWLALEAASPAEAPWRQMLSSQIDAAARQLGRDPAKLPGRQAAPPGTQGAGQAGATTPAGQGGPTAPAGQAGPTAPAGQAGPTAPAGQAGPTSDDVAKAANMTPEQRAAFIDSMVAGLASRLHDHPEDVDGWLRLADAYDKLGRPEQARDAWRQAAGRAPDRLEVQLAYAAAMAPLAEQGAPPADFADTVARIRKLDPDNALGLYCAGLVARARGDKTQARSLWQQVLARLPAGAPQRQELEAKLAALGQ